MGSGGRGFESRRPDYLRGGGATFAGEGATFGTVRRSTPRRMYEARRRVVRRPVAATCDVPRAPDIERINASLAESAGRLQCSPKLQRARRRWYLLHSVSSRKNRVQRALQFLDSASAVGGRCRAPAMRNGRCRMHGGRSRSGTAHGRYRHGRATREAIAMRRYLTALMRDARELLTGLQTAERRSG